MSITIKTAEEQQKMREAGAAAAQVLVMIEPHVRAGISTEELNRICHDYIVRDLGCVPAPLGYGQTPTRPAFPKSICTSVNHVVCHGIPGPKVLKKGDVLIRLEAAADRAQLNALEATAGLARQEYDRYQRLFKQGSISRSELDNRRAQRDHLGNRRRASFKPMRWFGIGAFFDRDHIDHVATAHKGGHIGQNFGLAPQHANAVRAI